MKPELAELVTAACAQRGSEKICKLFADLDAFGVLDPAPHRNHDGGFSEIRPFGLGQAVAYELGLLRAFVNRRGELGNRGVAASFGKLEGGLADRQNVHVGVYRDLGEGVSCVHRTDIVSVFPGHDVCRVA